METINKLQDLATHMDLEPAGEITHGAMGRIAPCGLAVEEKSSRKQKKNEDLGVFHAAMPGGKTIPLLKTLLTCLDRSILLGTLGLGFTNFAVVGSSVGGGGVRFRFFNGAFELGFDGCRLCVGHCVVDRCWSFGGYWDW